MDTFSQARFRRSIVNIGDAYGGLLFWPENLHPRAPSDAAWRALLYVGCQRATRYAQAARLLLSSADSRVRAWACFALGQLQDEQALEQIYSLNADPSNRVRIHAWQAVQAIVGPEESSRHFPIRVPTYQNKILISEDSPETIQFYRLILERCGFQVSSATTAEETLDQATRLKPNAMLTDNQKGFDNLSGLAMTSQLARDPDLRECILVMATADRVEPPFLWAGGDYFIEKPFSADELSRIMLEYLHH